MSQCLRSWKRSSCAVTNPPQVVEDLVGMNQIMAQEHLGRCVSDGGGPRHFQGNHLGEERQLHNCLQVTFQHTYVHAYLHTHLRIPAHIYPPTDLHRHTDTQTHRHTDTQTHRHRHRHRHRQTQTDRQTDTDRQRETDRQTDTDRQTQTDRVIHHFGLSRFFFTRVCYFLNPWDARRACQQEIQKPSV